MMLERGVTWLLTLITLLGKARSTPYLFGQQLPAVYANSNPFASGGVYQSPQLFAAPGVLGNAFAQANNPFVSGNGGGGGGGNGGNNPFGSAGGAANMFASAQGANNPFLSGVGVGANNVFGTVQGNAAKHQFLAATGARNGGGSNQFPAVAAGNNQFPPGAAQANNPFAAGAAAAAANSFAGSNPFVAPMNSVSAMNPILAANAGDLNFAGGDGGNCKPVQCAGLCKAEYGNLGCPTCVCDPVCPLLSCVPSCRIDYRPIFTLCPYCICDEPTEEMSTSQYVTENITEATLSTPPAPGGTTESTKGTPPTIIPMKNSSVSDIHEGFIKTTIATTFPTKVYRTVPADYTGSSTYIAQTEPGETHCGGKRVKCSGLCEAAVENDCPICVCPPTCPLLRCDPDCEIDFSGISSLCPICVCEEVRLPHCEAVQCGGLCSSVRGNDGCLSCVCDPSCPSISCASNCHIDYKANSNSCPRCVCDDGYVSPPFTGSGTFQSGRQSDMFSRNQFQGPSNNLGNKELDGDSEKMYQSNQRDRSSFGGGSSNDRSQYSKSSYSFSNHGSQSGGMSKDNDREFKGLNLYDYQGNFGMDKESRNSNMFENSRGGGGGGGGGGGSFGMDKDSRTSNMYDIRNERLGGNYGQEKESKSSNIFENRGSKPSKDTVSSNVRFSDSDNNRGNFGIDKESRSSNIFENRGGDQEKDSKSSYMESRGMKRSIPSGNPNVHLQPSETGIKRSIPQTPKKPFQTREQGKKMPVHRNVNTKVNIQPPPPPPHHVPKKATTEKYPEKITNPTENTQVTDQGSKKSVMEDTLNENLQTPEQGVKKQLTTLSQTTRATTKQEEVIQNNPDINEFGTDLENQDNELVNKKRPQNAIPDNFGMEDLPGDDSFWTALEELSSFKDPEKIEDGKNVSSLRNRSEKKRSVDDHLTKYGKKSPKNSGNLKHHRVARGINMGTYAGTNGQLSDRKYVMPGVPGVDVIPDNEWPYGQLSMDLRNQKYSLRGKKLPNAWATILQSPAVKDLSQYQAYYSGRDLGGSLSGSVPVMQNPVSNDFTAYGSAQQNRADQVYAAAPQSRGDNMWADYETMCPPVNCGYLCKEVTGANGCPTCVCSPACPTPQCPVGCTVDYTTIPCPICNCAALYNTGDKQL